ncbi:MAG: sigma-70 family RNA polymerase sigma factor [Marinilabiliaceae bacterium]|nr:sigma-70 family RNA polymerase sigma factor [Marinilabiliaceae bacterium]
MDSAEKEKRFLDLVYQNQGIIHKVCYIYCTNKSDREDLYQEISLQLWKSFASFKGRSQFSTWMYRVALNTAINMTKKPALIHEGDIKAESVPDLSFNDDSPEELKLLYKGISMLEKIEKAIILMWLDDKSYREISDTIGISEKNVSVRLVRIKQGLTEIIEKLL